MQWRHYVVIGVVNSAIPFLLFSFAALHLPASYSVILNSATPLFAALLSALFLAERLTPVKIAGLVAGAAGVALVSRAGPVVPDATVRRRRLPRVSARRFCYAASSIYMKKYAAGAKPMAIAGWSQVAAGVVLLPLVPFAPVRGARSRPPSSPTCSGSRCCAARSPTCCTTGSLPISARRAR